MLKSILWRRSMLDLAAEQLLDRRFRVPRPRALYRLPTAPASATAIQTSDTPEVRANMGRVMIYGNRIVRTYLDLQAMNKTNVLLRLQEFNGKVVTTFRDIPVRTCDAILSNEAQVT